MYRRRTKAERHANKVSMFEYYHPKNKYVMHRQAKRAWKNAIMHRLFSECLTKMAAEGNEVAQMMIRATIMMGSLRRSYETLN